MMVAFGVISLVLTAFMLIFYGYLSRHSERDVSFFMSVGIISMIMNLCTNMAGKFVLVWLYLAIAVVFLALGFAVSTKEAVGFYTSIGPWFRNAFDDMKTTGFAVLSTLVFPAGFVLYFVNYQKDLPLANACKKGAFWGIVLWAFLLWAILGLVL